MLPEQVAPSPNEDRDIGPKHLLVVSDLPLEVEASRKQSGGMSKWAGIHRAGGIV